jgi:alpha-1,4-digalacturonate transport system substrate-binding protein
LRKNTVNKLKAFILLTFMLVAVSVSAVYAQDPVEVRITWYDDGNEGEVLRDLLDRFEADNADIKVVVDTVPYTAILEQLPLQVEAGEGPDIARVTNLPGLAGKYLDLRPLLKDAAAWDESFPALLLQSMRTGDDTTGLYGFPNQFTVTGPYINRTLFEQANIPVPSDTNDAVTWEEWTEVAKQVASATGTQYAIGMDRSGHRFAGPAMSEGATFFDADGNVTIDTPGFRKMAEILVGWHKDNLTPAEIWVGSGGSYAAGADFFINGQLVFYMSGSWQVQRFSKDIADAFDWVVVPNPTGPGGSTGMPGGTGLVAFAETQHPQEVARVMEYLASQDVLGEFSARTLFIPGHLGLAKAGVEYQTDSEAARNALNGFLAEVPKLSEDGYKLNAHPQNSVIFNETRDRLTQVIVGELTLDEAITRIQTAVDDAIAAAKP